MILLTDDQRALLVAIVEASRQAKCEFSALRVMGGAFMQHPGFTGGRRRDVYWPDLIALSDAGVFTITSHGSHGGFSFDVSALGLAAYAEIKQSEGEPMDAVGREVTNYLDQSRFASRYARAYERWKNAAQILWSDHPEGHLSEAGHYCREAMQEFAEVLAEGLPILAETGKRDTVARARAALEREKGRLGTTLSPMLDALLVYWGTVADLAQRQEHAAEREGEQLQWEDARRLVFHTALVMYELDRSLDR